MLILCSYMYKNRDLPSPSFSPLIKQVLSICLLFFSDRVLWGFITLVSSTQLLYQASPPHCFILQEFPNPTQHQTRAITICCSSPLFENIGRTSVIAGVCHCKSSSPVRIPW